MIADFHLHSEAGISKKENQGDDFSCSTPHVSVMAIRSNYKPKFHSVPISTENVTPYGLNNDSINNPCRSKTFTD